MVIRTIRALKDNYCYLLTAAGSATAIVTDPSEAGPVNAALSHEGLRLGLILNTHHHHDHVGGNRELVERWSCPVYCSQRDIERVPLATRALTDGESFEFASVAFKTIAIPGHTEGQIAYLSGDSLFVGDTLFEMGCGRLFEGTAEQMFASLQLIQRLPQHLRLYFGHEYTETNARFAKLMEPANTVAIDHRLAQVRAEIQRDGHAQAPTIAVEKTVNPFLRAKSVVEFARLREARNTFQ